ncbi:MAG: hypothetical protein AABZ47_16080 [Planctomycetota bacterium]
MIQAFEELHSRVFRQRDIESILKVHRAKWRLAQTTGTREFIDYLKESGKLKKLEFPFPRRKEIRYTWGVAPLEEALLTLKPNIHFSHYTAVRMHGLTEQDPKRIYLNFEQLSEGTASGNLVQERIDHAFSRPQRVTNNECRIGELRICLLNGRKTGYLGVETRDVSVGNGPETVSARVTDIERTLIDITVRPSYAGGVAEVLKAYERAGSQASVNRLAALLIQLDHTYPYHQAVGFYLERSGAYSASMIDLFYGKFAREFDFYLTYQMEKPRFDSKWRLFVPRGF